MNNTTVTPAELTIRLKALITTLDAHGQAAVTLAPLLAARGYPTATIGDGPRGNSELTSVEAAASDPGHWQDVDAKLERFLAATYTLTLAGEQLIKDIVAHAASDETHGLSRSGAGTCLACTRPVAGTAVDRLRAGWCDACRKAWEREGRPDRALFQLRRPPYNSRAERQRIDPTASPANADTGG